MDKSLAKGTNVILHTQDEWNELYGTIDGVDNESETIHVFSVQIPYATYEIPFSRVDEMLEIINE